MAESYLRSRLWVAGLEIPDAPHEEAMALERLKTALVKMRSKVRFLVDRIHDDCKGLTVHDLSHLDALWEMADLLVDPTSRLTPTEAFVLGASILIHDAGLTAVAFPGGRQELEKTPQWKDNLQIVMRRDRSGVAKQGDPNNPTERQLSEIAFLTLRDLHAEVAASLATQTWPLDSHDEYLIEDTGLRQAYGEIIGKIAHSHHWDVERVGGELVPIFTAASELPIDWTVRPIYLAGILRCADAAHIDERRAPSFLYAISKPPGVSAEHWSFQNKLNKPTCDGDCLIYTSGPSFKKEEVAAWWRAFDTARMIDREIKNTNALFSEMDLPTFVPQRVFGVDSPRLFSKQVRTKGWEPVDAQIRVSNPIGIARMLGGSRLYGASAVPVFRELLQNATDAIRARRKLGSTPPNWGLIRIEISLDEAGGAWVHVDDNGIGMSQRVLTTVLVDFGRSLWDSSQMKEEYPGLIGADIKPIGKFGIGFFSVFSIADQVRVTSRRYRDGESEAHTLEFAGIEARPILRRAEPSDLPNDMSTRISLHIENLSIFNPTHRSRSPISLRRFVTLSRELSALVAALDVKVEFSWLTDEGSFIHDANWRELEASEFLTALYGPDAIAAWEKQGYFRIHANLLRPLLDETGRVWGRAAIDLTKWDKSAGLASSYISVGGYTTPGTGIGDLQYVGIIEGETELVDRSRGSISAPEAVQRRWLLEQAGLVSEYLLSEATKVAAGQELFRAGVRTDQLPVCFFSNSVKGLSPLRERMAELDRVCVPIRSKYDDNFEFRPISSLGIAYAKVTMSDDVILFAYEAEKLFDEEEAKARAVRGETEVNLESLEDGREASMMRELIRECWAGKVDRCYISTESLFSESVAGLKSEDLVLVVRRARS